jgi:hypothetical protein
MPLRATIWCEKLIVLIFLGPVGAPPNVPAGISGLVGRMVLPQGLGGSMARNFGVPPSRARPRSRPR